jgi:hypothetical protein
MPNVLLPGGIVLGGKDDSKDESLVFSRISGSARASNAVGEYRASSMASCGTRLGIRINGPQTLRLVFITERWRIFLFPESAASEVALFRAWSCFALGPPALRAVAVCVRHDGQQLLARLVNLSRILMSRRRLNVIGSN